MPDIFDEEVLRETALEEVALGIEAVPPNPGTEEDDTQSSQYLQEWARGFVLSSKTVLFAKEQRTASTPGGRSWPLELSLVLLAKAVVGDTTTAAVSPPEFSEVVLVSWRFAGKSGRIIEVDGQNKIVATNPTCRNFDCQTTHRGSFVILPMAGATAHKFARADRPLVPPKVLRLKVMFETALCNLQRGESESVSLDPCLLCGADGPLLLGSVCKTGQGEGAGESGGAGSHDDGEEQGSGQEQGPLLVCAFCLQSFHSACACTVAGTSDFASEFRGLLESESANPVPVDFGSDLDAKAIVWKHLFKSLHPVFKKRASKSGDITEQICPLCPLCNTVFECLERDHEEDHCQVDTGDRGS